MPYFHSRFYPENNICVLKTDAERFALDEFLDEFAAYFLSCAEWKPGMSILFDFNDVKSIDNSKYKQAYKIGKKLNADFMDKLGNGARAFVTGNDYVFGILKMWTKIMGTDEIVEVCRSYNDAFEWLKIENPSHIGE